MFSKVDATVAHGDTFIVGSSCVSLLNGGTIGFGAGGDTVVLNGQCGRIGVDDAPTYDGFTGGAAANIIDDRAMTFPNLSCDTITRTCLGETITIEPAARGSPSRSTDPACPSAITRRSRTAPAQE